MLKQKLQLLVQEQKLGTKEKFEVVNDSSALQVFGGVENKQCQELLGCSIFSGDCPMLNYCASYS